MQEDARCPLPGLTLPEKALLICLAGDAGEDDLPGFRKSLPARGEVGGLADHSLLLRRALADQIADHDKPGGNADADGAGARR